MRNGKRNLNREGTKQQKGKEDEQKGIQQGRRSNNKDGMRIICWNVAGILSKDRGFWNYVEKADMINLTETRMEEKSWEKVKKKKGWNIL